MRQNYRFTDDERRWLTEHWSDADVQSILLEPKTTAPNKRAAGLLTEKFRAHFTGPSTGETQDAWLKRYNHASRERRNEIARHAPEDSSAWSARMEHLPKSVYNWVREHRYTAARRKGDVRRRRSLTLPRTRKPREQTGLDVFQASPEAPEVEVIDIAGRPRAAVGQFRAACADAWKALLPEEREAYNVIAAEKNKEVVAEREESVAINGGFTSLEISNAVDDNMDMIHNVRWGGMICVGGPDETGEPSVYMTSRGVNRQGLTFLQALCKTAGWTEQEFYLVLSLWVEQSRTGKDNAEDADFAEHAQRVMEEHRVNKVRDNAQPVLPPAPGAGDITGNVMFPTPIVTACIDPTLRTPPAAIPVGGVIQGKSIAHARKLPLTCIIAQSNDVPGAGDFAEPDMDVQPEVSINIDIAAVAQPPTAGRKGQRSMKKVATTKAQAKGAGKKNRKAAETSGVVIPDASASSAVTSRPSRIRAPTARAQGQDPLMSLTERISAAGSISTGRGGSAASAVKALSKRKRRA